MIDEALGILKTELDSYLDTVYGPDDRVILTGIATETGGIAIPPKKLGISLINIEEERVLRDQRTVFQTQDGGIAYHNPDLKLNLYVLVTANFYDATSGNPSADYQEGLKQLSQVIRFFQGKKVFTQDNTPMMTGFPSLEMLVVELFSFSFEQLYNFWSVVGTRYLPSALYRVRLITIQQGIVQAPASVIVETNVEMFRS